MPNPVVRYQLISPDPNKSAAFYQKLFQWKINAANALGYREITSGGDADLTGGIWPSPPGQPGFVQMFVEVEDVDQCIEKAIGLGAKTLVPKSVLPDGDTMAVMLDPTGISFGLCKLVAR